MAESDGIDEAAEQMLRVALTAAAQLAERLAHARAQAAREAQARSDAREHSSRVDSEHRAARAQLTLTRDPRWWDTATGPEIADAYATALQWADLDPGAAHDADHIRRQVRDRSGPAAVPALTGPSPTGRLSPPVQRPGERAARAEGAVLLVSDARTDFATRTSAWLAEHAHELPDGLSPVETVEAVDARLRADLSQSRSATRATALGDTAQASAVARPRPISRAADVDLDRT